MPLTNKRIAELAERAGVRTTAVENFLGSLGPSEKHARLNLAQDAALYSWNRATVAAIRAGIKLAYVPAESSTRIVAENQPIRAKRAPRKPAVDREWQREQAMQAGMGMGVEAYNEVMGWDTGE